MKRHNKFPSIQNLDNELDLIVKNIASLGGKFIKEFPPISQVEEYSRFFKETSPGVYQEFIKINNEYRNLGGGTSYSSSGKYLYIAYAEDSSGTGYSTTPAASRAYIALLVSDAPISSPAASDFTGLWVKFVGNDGTGIPTGGTTGQHLAKASNDDYDTVWEDPPDPPVNLDDLSDVDAPTPSDGQALTWDSGTSKWKPTTLSLGGGGTALLTPSAGRMTQFINDLISNLSLTITIT